MSCSCPICKKNMGEYQSKMDISDGEDDIESEVLAPVVLPEDGVGIDGETPPSNENDGE